MPRKIVTLRDKYGSTTRYYPKVLKQCLPEELQDIFPRTKGNLTGKIYFDEWGDNSLAPVLEIKKDATHKAQLRVWGNNVLGNDVYGVEMEYQEGNSLSTVSIDKDGILLSGSNKDININTTGAGKLYINGEEYQAGGGSQLYQHNVMVASASFMYSDAYYSNARMLFSFICDTPSFNNLGALVSYLREHTTVVSNGEIKSNAFSNVPYIFRKIVIASGTSTTTIKTIGTMINSGNWNDLELDKISFANDSLYHIDSQPL